uniref:Glycosyl hydrolase family 88 n=1 Tax=Elaeophora elaphi TaxID=1147741 RepID=A0A0R3RPA7_9BILA
MMIKKLILPGLILASVYAKGSDNDSIDKGLMKQWWENMQWIPAVHKTESKRWWSGNFKPWDGDFQPWRENNGGEDFIVFPGGRFGAWGDRIFIEKKE